MSVSEETIRPLAAAPCLEDNAQVGVCDQTTCAVLGMNGLTAGEGFDFILTYPDSNLVGGWATPLKNMIVNWDDDSNPILMGKFKKMATKPPTSSIFRGC